MISFLKTLSIILLVYFAVRFLMKLAAPYLMRFVQKKAEQKMEQMFKGFPGAQSNPTNQHKEQEVSKKSSKVVGEYIDYEEVE